jgi:hypothetical protein
MSRAGWIITAGAMIALAMAGATAAAAHDDGCCTVRIVERDRVVVPVQEVVRTRIVIPHDGTFVRVQDDPDTRAVLQRTERTVGRAIGRSIGRTIGRMLGCDPAARRAPGVEADLLFDLLHIEGSV